MTKYNSYGRPLTAADIEHNRHRKSVGGLWEELGTLQLEFM